MPSEKGGRWSADDDEPFNAALGGVSPELFRYSGGSGNGCAMAFMWAAGIGLIALGFCGPSIILFAFGCILLAIAVSWTYRRFR